MKKFIFIISTIVLVVSGGCNKKAAEVTGQTIQGEAVSGTAIKLDNDKKKQIETYLRKALSVPEQYTMELQDAKPSKIAGLSIIPGRLTFQGRSQDFELFISNDGKYIVVGKLFDLEASPYERKDISGVNLTDVNSKGPKDAPITIIEYSDFQCPYCSRAYQTLENEVLKKYGKKVRLVFKHFPLDFHPWAMSAAIAAECAALQKKDAFWTFYDNFFQKQAEINPGNIKSKVLEWAGKAGLDKSKFEKCYDGQETKAKVEKDRQEGMSVGVSGTPGFFVNGIFLGGAMPAEKFYEIIESELAKR